MIQTRTALHRDLTAQQIHGLYAGSTFINRHDPDIPVVLLCVEVHRESIPAKHLQGIAGGYIRIFRWIGFNDGRQQLQHELCLFFFFTKADLLQIIPFQTLYHQTDRTFHESLLQQQHSAHIRVMNDQGLWFAQVLVFNMSSLGPLVGIFQCIVISSRRDRCRSLPHCNARRIHHLKHILQALVGLSNEISSALTLLAKYQMRSGIAALSHLLKIRHTVHVVVRQGPIGLRPVFWNDE